MNKINRLNRFYSNISLYSPPIGPNKYKKTKYCEIKDCIKQINSNMKIYTPVGGSMAYPLLNELTIV